MVPEVEASDVGSLVVMEVLTGNVVVVLAVTVVIIVNLASVELVVHVSEA